MTTNNSKLVSQYLTYLRDVHQNDPLSVELHRCHLRRLLFWAGDTSFEQVKEITPSFPIYLASSLGERTNKPLSPRFMNDTCATARAFFTWCQRSDKSNIEGLSLDWIEYLRPGKANRIDTRLRSCEFYSLEDVRKILAVEPQTIMDERGQAATAFLFLSGMRIRAFTTLPISCVDLDNYKIYQLPSRGVSTKFHKAAVTTLLRIPDLLDFVKAWDKRVRDVFSPGQTWFAPIYRKRYRAGCFDITDVKASPNREKGYRKELEHLCKLADIPYRSAHKLRHGHAIYGIKHARDMKELKAVSQNLMHDSISMTDGIYGNLNEDDMCSAIASLGTGQPTELKTNGQADMNTLILALAKLQANPALLQTVLAA